MYGLMRIFLVFSFSIVRTSALHFIPEKLKTGVINSNVTLRCHTDKHDVAWMFNNGQLDTEFQKPNGRTLRLIDLQEDLVGNYSCWSDRGMEDYTYLLLDKSMETTVSNIHCTAESLSCSKSIKCFWSSDEFTAFRLRNTRDNGDWVSQSVDGAFLLPHLTDSFSEESERLLITGEAVSKFYYMSTNHSFFLRDIVKPAHPDISISGIKNKGSDKQVIEVEVTPPPSWPQPHSFFPLKHQMEYQIRHNGHTEKTEWEEGWTFTVEGSIRKLRVRSRDPLLLSQWSEWTSWKNVSSGTKGNKRNKVANKKNTKHKKKNCKHKREKNHQKNRQKNRKHLNWAHF